MKDIPSTKVILALFAIALAVRLIYLKQVISTPVFLGLSMDSNLFDKLAMQIVTGDWAYKDSIYLNEFYQFFLALIYRVFGLNHKAVFVIQALLDSASCLLIFYVASKAFGRLTGALASSIYAFYGIAIFYTGLILDTTVSIFLQLLFISLLFYGSGKKHALAYHLLSGIVFGLLLMARPNLILFMLLLPIYGIFLLRKTVGTQEALKYGIIFTLGSAAVLSLSAARHYAYFDELSPFAAHGGFNFYIGNNEAADGVFMSPSGISSNPVSQIKTSIRVASKETGKDLSPYEASEHWLQKGLDYLKTHPLDATRLYLKKVFLFFRKEEIGLNIDYRLSKELIPLFKVPFVTYGVLSPLCLVGLFMAFKHRNEKGSLLVLYYGACALSILLFFISDRYRLPSVPFAVIFASLAMSGMLKHAASRAVKKVFIVLLPAAFVFFLVSYEFNGITENSPTGTHYNNLAILYNRLGSPEKAEENLKKAIGMDPLLAASHNNLGQLYVENGKMELGMDHLKRALEMDPNYAVAHYNLGMALERKGRTEDARRHYLRAVDLSPNLVEAQVNLGTLLTKTGDLKDAEKHFRAALQEDPSFIPALEALGGLQAKSGDFEAAVVTFKGVLKEDPRHYDARVNIALAYRRMGKLEEAIAWYGKAIESDSGRSEAYVQLGSVLTAKGEGRKAMALYQKALELDPESYDACIKLGIEYGKEGNLERAIEYFKHSVQIRPEGEQGRLNLAKAYLVRGNKASALEEYLRIRELNPEAAKELEKYVQVE